MPVNRDAVDPRAAEVEIAALPVIDLALLASGDDTDRSTLVSQLRTACTNNGFFYLVNHGVPDGLIRDVLASADALFALDASAKAAIAADHSSGLGFGRMGGKALSGRPGAAVKEEYYCSREGQPGQRELNRWPASLPAFRSTLEAYLEAMHDLAARVMALLAETMALPADHFAGFCDRPLATVRLVRYPPEGAEAGAHTDFGALTFLLQHGVGGLQVFDRVTDGWIHADPLDGSFIVNLGDLFEVWTNRTYRSTPHRVVHPAGVARISVPFFFTGAAHYPVQCLPAFLPGDGSPVPAPMTPGAHLEEAHAAQGF